VADTLVEQAVALRVGDVSSRELTRMYLERIDALDTPGALNSFILSRGDEALDDAARLDARRSAGEVLGPLHGVPIAVKDNIAVRGHVTSAGSVLLDSYVPDAEATVITSLVAAGAVVLGKTNLHEFCFGITSNNRHFGAVRNPYDRDLIPGGSSGGSAVAVASRLCAGSIGTDTGGSLRIPAALCGVVGIKPTFGRVSRGGVIGLSPTVDVVGPIARTVGDASVLLEVMSAGRDLRDAAAMEDPAHTPVVHAIDGSDAVRGLRVGVPDGYFASDNTPDVDIVIARAHRALEDAGAILIPVSVDQIEVANSAGFVIVVPEAVESISRALSDAGLAGSLAEHLHSLGPDVQSTLSAEVGEAPSPIAAHAFVHAIGQVVPAIKHGFARALAGVDVLMTPVTPSPAIAIGLDAEMTLNGRTVPTFETFVRYTFGVSLAGLPAISVPAGLSASGLPIGVQFIGRRWSEAGLVEVAGAFERIIR
jgi:Asp-tRNA(Asn)/Glu-tRNA(Gln) amidotransferase A subunit family amidase